MPDFEGVEFDTTDWFKSITLDMTFVGVDPELLGLLTGGVMGTKPEPTFAIDFNFPVKRTFWQWLRRKPKQWRRVYVPNVTMGEVDSDG